MVIILGLGQQSKAIIYYLLNHTQEKILSIDCNKKKENWFSGHPQIGRWQHIIGSWSDIFQTTKNNNNYGLQAKDIVIDCLPVYKAEDVVFYATNNNCHYINLGGSTYYSKEIYNNYKNLALSKEITVIPDVGVAPGLVGSLISEYYTSDKMEIYCGGLPQKPKNLPIGYIKSFSVGGLLEEYTNLPEITINNERKSVAPLSGKESLYISPLGCVEAARTSGSLGYIPEDNKIPANLDYKTIRYVGHWDFIENTILKSNNPTGTLERLLKSVSSVDSDILVLAYQTFYGAELDASKILIWRYDEANDISAMAQATGYTVASVVNMILDKNVGFGCKTMYDISFCTLLPYIKKVDCLRMMDGNNNIFRSDF